MNIPYFLVNLISIAFEIYIWLIVARVVLSFFKFRQYYPVLRFIYEATEPVLGFFRRIMPRTGVFDFSPLIAVLALEVARQLVFMLLRFLFSLAG